MWAASPQTTHRGRHGCYTAAGTVALTPGFRLKASAELWAFSNDVPVHQDLEAAFHLGVVGTF